MTALTGWLGLVVGEWTINDDARSCARRAVRAGRALGLRTLAVSTDEQCLARLAGDGWSMRPAFTSDPAGLAAAFTPAWNRAVAPALLLGDGVNLSETTARVVALLGGRTPDLDAVARCAEVIARHRVEAERNGIPAGRYVAQAQDGEVIGIAEDVTVNGRGRDYDCPGSADGRTGRALRARVRAALDATRLTRGPVEVTVRADGRGVSVVDIAPGRINACIASVVELATGYDPILAAVRAAATPGARPPVRRAVRRHACLRRGDMQAAPAYADAAWVGLPGLVSVRPGPDGVVVTVADDRASAARAAESAVDRLSERTSLAAAASGGAR
ncbi:hypothetical protein WEI85_21305 [Actinomycetes bacterium KLBMP 9797]